MEQSHSLQSYKMRLAFLILLLLISLIAAGCGSMDDEQARSAALEFVKDRVRFYSQDQGYEVNPHEYVYQFTESYMDGKDRIFLINISHARLNDTRSALIKMRLNSRTGEVISFDQIRQEESFK